MLFITSEVDIVTDPSLSADATTSGGTQWSEPGGALAIEVWRVDGVKCPRCWRYVRSVSAREDQASLCERCADALSETVRAG